MKRQIIFVLLIGLLSVPLIARAQAPDECSAISITDTFNELVDGFRDELFSAKDTNDALEIVSDAQVELGALIDRCANLAASSDEQVDTGDGSLEAPYAFNYPGDSEAGFSIQVTGIIKPADSIVRNANMFNDRPQPGQVYIILDVEIECYETSARCEASEHVFELVGDNGVVYENPYIVLDNVLDVSLFGGASGSGRLAFLVDASDTGLTLLYRDNMFRDEVVAYRAEPDMSSGLQVLAATSINIRNAPTTNAGVVGTLAADTPVVAFGRNEDGTWLQIATGWIFAELVTYDGEISDLPVTAP